MERVLDTLSHLPGFLEAAGLALLLALLAIVLSWIGGLILALMVRAPLRLVRGVARFYIWFIRGTPTLIQIFVVYFGLPQLGLAMPAFTAGVIALGLSGSAYVAEILRSGFNAVPRGQYEAAASIALGPIDRMRFVILPQLVRIVVPALTNEAMNTLKNTSLLSAITITEVTLYAKQLIASTFRPFDFYILAAFLYLAMAEVLNQFARWYERRYPALTT